MLECKSKYKCCTMSNYFRVKDETIFRELLDKAAVLPINVKEKVIEDEKYFSFASYNDLGMTIVEDGNNVLNYMVFYDQLADIVHDKDVATIFEIGHSELDSFTAEVRFVSSTKVCGDDLINIAQKTVRKMLADKEYEIDLGF